MYDMDLKYMSAIFFEVDLFIIKMFESIILNLF